MSTRVDFPKAKSQDDPVGTRESIEAALVANIEPVRLYRLSVEQYNQMADAGILTKQDRIELIEGLLFHKMTKHARHTATTWLIFRVLEQLLPRGDWFIAKEDPIRLARSEPEPDIAVLRGRLEEYFQRKPNAQDVSLVIEVSESSYDDDRRKRFIYAEAGIPVYWIVNLNANRIEVYTDPTGPDPSPEYRTRREYASDSEIPLMIGGQEWNRLAVAELLAPAER